MSGEAISTLEWITRVVAKLRSLEVLRMQIQEQINRGQAPTNLAEFNLLKAEFDVYATPLVLFAGLHDIEAGSLDRIIRNGDNNYSEEAFATLLKLQVLAIKMQEENARQPSSGEPVCYAEMSQLAVAAGVSKRTLERALKDHRMPPPDIAGDRGINHQWEYSGIRTWLEATYGKILPEKPPPN